jgi:twitching motility protein PilT
MLDIDACLRHLVEIGGSDLHLKVPSPPLCRLDGDLVPVPGTERLTPQDTEHAVFTMLHDKDKLQEFATDVRWTSPTRSTAPAASASTRSTSAAPSRSSAARSRSTSARSTSSTSPVISELAHEERGIILVTGTTGSGKSTTLAAMIDEMNETGSKHIVTIEDPIEFLHRDKKSIINQREVGQDTHSFKRALRRVLRQDPDVILIGEMRDEETVHTALSAAETGHLVLSTVHTVDAPETINRVIDFFPPHMHQQVRAMLAGTLKGVISQRLVRSTDGGRVATCEILRMTGRVKDMIMDPEPDRPADRGHRRGRLLRMQTFDQALFDHVKAGRVSVEEATRAATSPHDFKLLLAATAAAARRWTTWPTRPRATSRATPSSPRASTAPAGPRSRARSR